MFQLTLLERISFFSWPNVYGCLGGGCHVSLDRAIVFPACSVPQAAIVRCNFHHSHHSEA